MKDDQTPRQPSPARLLRPAEAAEQLGVTAKTLERWRGAGDGPAYVRCNSKTIRYRSDDLDAFVLEHLRKNTAE